MSKRENSLESNYTETVNEWYSQEKLDSAGKFTTQLRRFWYFNLVVALAVFIFSIWGVFSLHWKVEQAKTALAGPCQNVSSLSMNVSGHILVSDSKPVRIVSIASMSTLIGNDTFQKVNDTNPCKVTVNSNCFKSLTAPFCQHLQDVYPSGVQKGTLQVVVPIITSVGIAIVGGLWLFVLKKRAGPVGVKWLQMLFVSIIPLGALINGIFTLMALKGFYYDHPWLILLVSSIPQGLSWLILCIYFHAARRRLKRLAPAYHETDYGKEQYFNLKVTGQDRVTGESGYPVNEIAEPPAYQPRSRQDSYESNRQNPYRQIIRQDSRQNSVRQISRENASVQQTYPPRRPTTRNAARHQGTYPIYFNE